MPLQSINIPDDIKQLHHPPGAEQLIDLANERIEKFMLATDSVTDNFVPCDFHLLDQSLTWIEQNNLLTGNRFCEFGSGFGVAALLASLRSMEAVGIEIESYLVDQASELADHLGLSATFYCGSFVPRDLDGILELGRDMEHVEVHEGEVYEEIGLGLDDFDLFFAFPWPGEHTFFRSCVRSGCFRQFFVAELPRPRRDALGPQDVRKSFAVPWLLLPDRGFSIKSQHPESPQTSKTNSD